MADAFHETVFFRHTLGVTMVIQINLTPEELNQLKAFARAESEGDAIEFAAREFLRVTVPPVYLGSLDFGLGRRCGEDAARNDPHLIYP
ncbi:hypothetical protein [Planctomicrobium piriforme]|uniref:Uncharacterized protein n=1 Tax=Planctomicrobium piriforme TaxID=1576369 RepID=A0A1I3RTN6_9PLAN|nr:hypothetical protein [Planctomicrobium piriforme]SFJ49923.1 hypothetical protein SAMN05421753_1221 [Planctomicrobium piriforme]